MIFCRHSLFTIFTWLSTKVQASMKSLSSNVHDGSIQCQNFVPLFCIRQLMTFLNKIKIINFFIKYSPVNCIIDMSYKFILRTKEIYEFSSKGRSWNINKTVCKSL